MTFVANGSPSPVLPALRALLDGADEALLCSAFVDLRGVHLVAKELRALGPRARLVATSTFGGGRTLAALDAAAEAGVRCRVLNPPRGTFHPKVTVVRRGRGDQALVGSANLTSGLVVNVEAGVVLGEPSPAVREAAESWWERGTDLDAVYGARERDVLEPDLWEALRAAVSAGDVVPTLATGSPNRVVALERTGLEVTTPESDRKGTGPQPVEPRMLQLAWDVLRTEGELTNRRLLEDLRVHRSSFVCAVLAQLPEVEVVRRRPITLRWLGDLRLAAEPSGPGR